jgi:heme/copper-type cytochrome/quinol oxidase subunit 1
MKTGLVAMGVGAGVLAIVGVVLILLPASSASFGWFAYQPVADFGFVGGLSPVPPAHIWGIALLVIAMALGAFAAGWALGSARTRKLERSGRA